MRCFLQVRTKIVRYAILASALTRFVGIDIYHAINMVSAIKRRRRSTILAVKISLLWLGYALQPHQSDFLPVHLASIGQLSDIFIDKRGVAPVGLVMTMTLLS